MMPRIKLRTCLAMVAASALLCWAATRVGVWYARRPTYQALASYHRSEAQGLESSRSQEALLYKHAAHYLPNLLAHPEFDLRRATPGNVRSDTFHPFSGPRSGWTAAVEAQRERVEQLTEKAAFHARMAREYRRASESFFAPTPTEGFMHPLPPWVDPEVLEKLNSKASGKAMPPSP